MGDLSRNRGTWKELTMESEAATNAYDIMCCVNYLIIIITSFAPISSKFKLRGATKSRD